MNEKTLELAYLAGFFDGEGSVYIAVTKGKVNRSFVLQINATNNDVRPLLALQKAFGGHVATQGPREEGWRQSYFWQTNSIKAEIALTAMLPYLKIKAEQVKLALAFREVQKRQVKGRIAIGFGHGYEPFTPEQIEEKQVLREALHILNTGGVKSRYNG